MIGCPWNGADELARSGDFKKTKHGPHRQKQAKVNKYTERIGKDREGYGELREERLIATAVEREVVRCRPSSSSLRVIEDKGEGFRKFWKRDR